MVLLLEERRIETIVRHSNSFLPIEAYRVLMGTVEGQIRIVKTVEAVDNLAGSSCSYRIPSEELYHMLIDGEENGESLVRFYHGHPS